MNQLVTVMQASKITGLSEYALRQGIKQNRYPHIRVGQGNGKIIMDIDLLQEYLEQEMRDSVKPQSQTFASVNYGELRRVVE